jgi:hypothetical protein
MQDQVRVTPAQPGSLPLNRWKRHVAMVAFLVGFCVGALTLLAGFIGLGASGTGIMGKNDKTNPFRKL